MPDGRQHVLCGLPPVIGNDPVVLILGSFPSVQSLRTGQYYANVQNQFWKIIGYLFGTDPALPYEERTRLLVANQIALYDAIGSCRRTGSADSRIENPVANDIAGLLASHPGIRLIACNGTSSAGFVSKLDLPGTVTIIRLPSTSPAHARLSLAEKIRQWSVICNYL